MQEINVNHSNPTNVKIVVSVCIEIILFWTLDSFIDIMIPPLDVRNVMKDMLVYWLIKVS